MGYPFEWALGMLKAKMPVRRRSWPANEFVTTLGREVSIQFHVPKVPREWALLANKPGQYPEIVNISSKTLVGFMRVSRESDHLIPFVPTYDDMVAEDWDSAYGI